MTPYVGVKYGWILLPALLAIGVAVGCSHYELGSGASTYSPLADPDYMATVKVGNSAGIKISPTFMGLSHEWGRAQAMMGSSATGVNTIYRTLLTNLTAYGSEPVVIRIGGDLTDFTGQPSSNVVRPFAELAEALGNHFYLGVNLGKGDVQLATEQAKAYLSQMPSGYLDAIEIGNEPDNYRHSGARPESYDFDAYLNEFALWRGRISPLLPAGTKLIGPSWAAIMPIGDVNQFDAKEQSTLYAFTQHFYAGCACNGYHNPSDFLLRDDNTRWEPSFVAPAVAASHRCGIGYRLDEMNSLCCSGQRGLSDSFSASLWAIDTMFELANIGVDGVNWHNGNETDPYDLFVFAATRTDRTFTYSLHRVNPLYYGLLFFQAATSTNSHLLHVNVDTNANMKAWATADDSGKTRLVLINKDRTATGRIKISIPGYTAAAILRLSAPSYLSTTGVTFAGQTFDGSTDGKIRGTQTVETVNATNGIFVVEMPPTGAALINFSNQ